MGGYTVSYLFVRKGVGRYLHDARLFFKEGFQVGLGVCVCVHKQCECSVGNQLRKSARLQQGATLDFTVADLVLVDLDLDEGASSLETLGSGREGQS